MGRIYVATFEDIAVSAVQDLFELVAPATGVVVVHRCEIGNESSETSEQLAIRMVRGYTVSGSGGGAVTPVPLQSGDPAADSTVERNNTTVANTGTAVTLGRRTFNLVGGGWLYEPTPETRIVLAPSERLVFHLPVAPSAAVDLSGELVFEEIGG